MSQIDKPDCIQSLMTRVNSIAGMTLSQCAADVRMNVPSNQLKHKGWIGSLMEKVLGADESTLPIPDFSHLGIELKTLPIGRNGKPSESTFVASIALNLIQHERWETSVVKQKLSHVLWIPVEDEMTIPLAHRRIGQGFLWRPNEQQQQCLKADWCELTELIVFGKFESISAKLGQILQIRPKASDGKMLRKALDMNGDPIRTLPRGFYLRSHFTDTLYKAST